MVLIPGFLLRFMSLIMLITALYSEMAAAPALLLYATPDPAPE